MTKGEPHPELQTEQQLSEIRSFLELQARNARFFEKGGGAMSEYHKKQAEEIEEAIADMVNGHYDKALVILGEYHASGVIELTLTSQSTTPTRMRTTL